MKVVLLVFGLLVVGAATVSADETSIAGGGCIYDIAKGEFRALSDGDEMAIAARTLRGHGELFRQDAILVDGWRFEKGSLGRSNPEELNEALQYKASVYGVPFFAFRNNPYADVTVAIGDAENCIYMSFNYRPQLHFAWMEEKFPGMSFVFKHPALAVDAASFKREGKLMRGVGFEMLGHPHKLEDGTQPMFNRTFIEVNCEDEQLRVLDQRSYGPDYTALQILMSETEWAGFDKVYSAIRMLAAAMCDVPESEWKKTEPMPGDIYEFSRFVHAKAHEKS